MEADNNYINENKQPEQLIELNKILSQLTQTLENGRNGILKIVGECADLCHAMEIEQKEMEIKAQHIINEVDRLEKLLRFARLRLMEVSRDFRSYSQKQIKEAYEKARDLQIKLIELRQEENFVRLRRDELSRSLRKIKKIGLKADNFLQNANLALKILSGNVEKINDMIEESLRHQQIAAWIIQSQEMERRKIARDLHDGPAQALASMLIRLELIERLGAQNDDSFIDEINSVKNMGKETLEEIRRLMYDLKPSIVQENLSTTLRDYFNDYEAKYDFTIDFVVIGQERQYDYSLEIALFRLVQESLTNIRKHAGVTNALVKLEDNGKMLSLVIKDNGRGFDLKKTRNKESYGILGMMERVNLIRGKLDIISSPGAGTKVVIRVPLEGEAKSEENKDSNS